MSDRAVTARDTASTSTRALAALIRGFADPWLFHRSRIRGLLGDHRRLPELSLGDHRDVAPVRSEADPVGPQ